uniref:Uncharacterized protein n=1 Tax=Syphacia muris TaxID=451379 RepID=A0A0N5AWU8_9BILA
MLLYSIVAIPVVDESDHQLKIDSVSGKTAPTEATYNDEKASDLIESDKGLNVGSQSITKLPIIRTFTITNETDDIQKKNDSYEIETLESKTTDARLLEVDTTNEMSDTSKMAIDGATTSQFSNQANLERRYSTESRLLQASASTTSATTASVVTKQPNSASRDHHTASTTVIDAQKTLRQTTESILMRVDKLPLLNYSNFLLKFFKKL